MNLSRMTGESFNNHGCIVNREKVPSMVALLYEGCIERDKGSVSG